MVGERAAVARLRWQGAEHLWLDAFAAFNFLCLTGDIVIAHSENHFRHPAEYIPVWTSPLIFLIAAVALAGRIRNSAGRASTVLAYLAGWLAIVVGVAGLIYHLDSSFFAERTLKSLTYAAPFAAPLSYLGLGCLVLMNRMVQPHSLEWAQRVLFFAL